MTKRCLTCGEVKAITEFSTNGYPADRVTQAYRPSCKPCTAASKAQRHASRTPEQIDHHKALRHAQYHRNRVRDDVAREAWRLANPDRVREIRRAAQRRHRERNLEHVRALGRRQQLARRVGRRPEDVAYGELLLRDPCSYCGEPAATIDHIVPLACGGANCWENLTAACGRCNSRKRHKSLLVFLVA